MRKNRMFHLSKIECVLDKRIIKSPSEIDIFFVWRYEQQHKPCVHTEFQASIKIHFSSTPFCLCVFIFISSPVHALQLKCSPCKIHERISTSKQKHIAQGCSRSRCFLVILCLMFFYIVDEIFTTLNFNTKQSFLLLL